MAEIKKSKNKFNIDSDEMAQAGIHFGHRTSKINPKMMPYISGIRNNIHIIDLEKTKEELSRALDFIEKLVSEGKILLMVGTKIQVKEIVKGIAQECSMPYITERWLGGTFTNLGSILKRVEYYKELERKRASGELEKYTKKEKAEFDKEIKKLEIKFKGIKDLNRLPDAIFVCDMIKDKLAIKEAREKGIKVLAICDTNTNPALADYPIPASDDAVPSVSYILEKLKEIIIKAKLCQKKSQTKESQAKE